MQCVKLKFCLARYISFWKRQMTLTGMVSEFRSNIKDFKKVTERERERERGQKRTEEKYASKLSRVKSCQWVEVVEKSRITNHVKSLFKTFDTFIVSSFSHGYIFRPLPNIVFNFETHIQFFRDVLFISLNFSYNISDIEID